MNQEFVDISEWEVLTPQGWQDFYGVIITKDRLTIQLETGLICTPDHMVLRGGDWVEAQSLQHTEHSTQTVYDLYDVSNGNCYYTGAEVSHNCHMLLLDEFAFVPNNIADEFFASVYPTISSGKKSKIAVISTPNGMNHFYKLVKEAESTKNGFNLTKAIWSDIPGRDQKWADDQRSVLGDVKWRQEMCCEFQGASSTLISGPKLTSMVADKPIHQTQTVNMYEQPKPGHSYISVVDTARGTGNDYSAFIVFDVTTLPYRIVMTFQDNMISPLLYPGLLHKQAVAYNNAAVLIETNDIGEQIASSLYHDFEYEETLMSTKGALSAFGGESPGLRTTKKTKSVGCATLKTLVENDQLIINDYAIIYELSNFVVKGQSYEADNGNDDLAMCLVIFAYLTTQPIMEDLSSQSAKERIIQMKQERSDAEALPQIFFRDGTERDEDEVLNF